jgi:hypothetical protein
MSTKHMNAAPGDFADTVLMPGDPLRAQYIADTYLDDALSKRRRFPTCSNAMRILRRTEHRGEVTLKTPVKFFRSQFSNSQITRTSASARAYQSFASWRCSEAKWHSLRYDGVLAVM